MVFRPGTAHSPVEPLKYGNLDESFWKLYFFQLSSKNGHIWSFVGENGFFRPETHGLKDFSISGGHFGRHLGLKKMLNDAAKTSCRSWFYMTSSIRDDNKQLYFQGYRKLLLSWLLGCETVVRPSYLYNENPYTGKTASLYWNDRQSL